MPSPTVRSTPPTPPPATGRARSPPPRCSPPCPSARKRANSWHGCSMTTATSCSSACMTRTGYNVHVLPCGIIAPETSGWFKNEINSMADLEGLNMRFFGLGAEVMQRLGVSTSLACGWRHLPGAGAWRDRRDRILDAADRRASGLLQHRASTTTSPAGTSPRPCSNCWSTRTSGKTWTSAAKSRSKSPAWPTSPPTLPKVKPRTSPPWSTT